MFRSWTIKGTFKDEPYRLLTLGCIVNQVKSRGSLQIVSKDPTVSPKIDPKFLTNPEDLERLAEVVKVGLEFKDQKPFADLVQECLFPPFKNETEFLEVLKKRFILAWHPVGTCKMSNKPDGVVDSDLKVKGVKGLRVADASIMPRVVSGNTNVASLVIGMKAAEIILKQYSS